MRYRNLTIVGLLTLVIVGAPSVMWEIQHGTLLTARSLEWMVAYLAFAACFAISTRRQCTGSMQVLLALLETVLALVCVLLEPPNEVAAVLFVIVAGQLGGLRLSAGLAWVAIQTAALWVVFAQLTDSPFPITAAYFAFQLFGLSAVRIAHTESEMRQALAEANTELKIATGLLEIESRAEERLRVSRDLHDLIGHHLTALTLNLEVATHLTSGPAREQIEKSKALAKLLLSDVRDVVGRLRKDEPVNLGAAIESLRDAIGAPAMHLDIPAALSVSDPEVAKTALRVVQEVVTNAVRHSGARNLWLTVATADHTLLIHARDDGTGTDQITFGNGFRGMQERVDEMHGSLHVTSSRSKGFEVHVRLPLGAAP